MVLVKDGLTYRLTDETQIAAFKKCGWVEREADTADGQEREAETVKRGRKPTAEL